MSDKRRKASMEAAERRFGFIEGYLVALQSERERPITASDRERAIAEWKDWSVHLAPAHLWQIEDVALREREQPVDEEIIVIDEYGTVVSGHANAAQLPRRAGAEGTGNVDAYGSDEALVDVQRVRDWMEGQDYMAVERAILDRVLRFMRGYDTKGTHHA